MNITQMIDKYNDKKRAWIAERKRELDREADIYFEAERREIQSVIRDAYANGTTKSELRRLTKAHFDPVRWAYWWPRDADQKVADDAVDAPKYSDPRPTGGTHGDLVTRTLVAVPNRPEFIELPMEVVYRQYGGNFIFAVERTMEHNGWEKFLPGSMDDTTPEYDFVLRLQREDKNAND